MLVNEKHLVSYTVAEPKVFLRWGEQHSLKKGKKNRDLKKKRKKSRKKAKKFDKNSRAPLRS